MPSSDGVNERDDILNRLATAVGKLQRLEAARDDAEGKIATLERTVRGYKKKLRQIDQAEVKARIGSDR